MLTSLGGLWALFMEWDVLRNTLGATNLALYAVGAGALLLLVLRPFERRLCVKDEERWAIPWIVAVGILTGSVAVVSHTNHRYGEAGGHIEYLPVLDKEYVPQSAKVPEQWTLSVKVLGREKWIWVSEADWRSVSSGDSYPAVIQNGYWGFHVIGCPNKCGQDAAQSGSRRCLAPGPNITTGGSL